MAAFAGLAFMAQAAPLPNVLIVYGSDGLSGGVASQLSNDFFGNANVTTNIGMPPSLATFNIIYDVRTVNIPNFSASEQQAYLDFLNAAPGNTIVLIGENSAFYNRNNTISQFVTLAGGGSISPYVSDSYNTETIYPPFGSAALTDTVKYAACGKQATPGTGQFASSESNGGCAIYWGPGSLQQAPRGALLVVYDVNFISTAPTNGASNETAFRLKMELVAATTPAGPSVTTVLPASGPPAGGTTITITGVGFTGATGVTVNGTPATGVVVNSDTSITAITPPGSAGPASVRVTTDAGSSPSNSLFTYGEAGKTPPLQISLAGPVGVQVVSNESMLTTGVANILANQTALYFKAATTTPWLTLTGNLYSLPGLLHFSVDATGFKEGSYTGNIDVTAYDPNTNNPVSLKVPVNLTVLPPALITATPSNLPSAFGQTQGVATGYDIQVGPAGIAFTVQTSGNSDSWLSVSPKSGIAPATLHVTIDPSKATNGNYFDAIQILSAGAPNSPLAIPVQMIRSNFMPQLPQQVNAASGAGPDHTIAPNEILSLFLTDFGCPADPVVSINGTKVPWASFAPGQINYSTPGQLPNPSSLTVSCNGVTTWSFNSMLVASTIPGIFTAETSGKGLAAARNSDGKFNAAANPVGRGDLVSLLVTGFGTFADAGADGLRHLNGTVTAEIGGEPAEVQYAGEQPGAPDGVQRVDVLVPRELPQTGANVPIRLWIDGTPAQSTATIAVR